MSWNDERIELLKKLHGQNLSYAQIAKQLGGVTRNGVCGKIHRLGLSLPQAPAAPGTSRPSPAPRPRQPKPKGVMVPPPMGGRTQANPHENKVAGMIANAEARANPAASVVLMSRGFTPLPGCAPVPFGSPGCRWPVGGEGADMLCCGAERVPATPTDPAPSYCASHGAVAYQKPRPGQPRTGNELARSLRRWAA